MAGGGDAGPLSERRYEGQCDFVSCMFGTDSNGPRTYVKCKQQVLSDQKWLTVTLPYLRQLDLISSRRAGYTTGATSTLEKEEARRRRRRSRCIREFTYVPTACCLFPPLDSCSENNLFSFLGKNFPHPMLFHLPCFRGLPLTFYGLWTFHWYRGPKLPRRRFLTLFRKSLLHIVIAALDFLHDGFRESDLHLLGRRPNAIQKMIHVRLWSLIATCDSRVDVPFTAGRSGPELFARLRELENFASPHELLSQDLYESGAADLETTKTVGNAGRISGEGRRKAAEDTGGLAQYRPLDAGRLKLTGSGNWPVGDHLHDELWLPFVEPAIPTP